MLDDSILACPRKVIGSVNSRPILSEVLDNLSKILADMPQIIEVLVFELVKSSSSSTVMKE